MKIDVTHFDIEVPETWEAELSSRKKENDIHERNLDIHSASIKKTGSLCTLDIDSIEMAIYPYEDHDRDQKVEPFRLSEFVGRVRKCSFGDFSGVFDFTVEDDDAGEVIVKDYILTNERLSLQIKARCLRSASKIDLVEAEGILSSLRYRVSKNA